MATIAREVWLDVEAAAAKLGTCATDAAVAGAAEPIAADHGVPADVIVNLIEGQLALMTATEDGTVDHDDEARLDRLHLAIAEEEAEAMRAPR